MKICRLFSGRMGQLGLALFLVMSWSFSVSASSKMYHVGIVLPDDEWSSSVEGLKDGMKSLGYTEGINISYEIDNAKGDKARILASTNKFIGARFDALYTATNTGLKIVTEATRASKTPVVFGSASGPVESGIAKGYVNPDSHVTGVTSGSLELVPKRLEILKEVLPKVKTLALIGDAEADSSKAAFRLAAEIAPKLALSLVEIRIKSKEEALASTRKLTRKTIDAIFLLPGLLSVASAPEVAAQALAERIPFAVYQVEHVKIAGSLISFGSSYYLDGKQSAALMDKILKGTEPGQLPIERPRNIKLIFNLATAQNIGFTFSPAALERADEVLRGPNKK